MSIDDLKNALPDYARDLKLNLTALPRETTLTAQQTYGGMLAAALASRNQDVIRAIAAEASQHLTPEALSAAKAATAIMGMNNIYYRSVHLIADPDYAAMPARLRMNVMANPGVAKADFELWSLIVSAVNGCGMCLDSHEKTLRHEGVSKEAIQHALRIAAVIHAVAVTLEGESTFIAETVRSAA